MNKRKTGVILIVGSVLIWGIDRFTHIISSTVGQLRCGERYFQPVNGVVGDASCGFNDDMYLVVLLFVVLVVGIVRLCKKDKSPPDKGARGLFYTINPAPKKHAKTANPLLSILAP